MSEVWIIEGGRVLDPSTGEDEVRDVVVVDRVFAKDAPQGVTPLRVDARGKWVMPGLIDVHAHFREGCSGTLQEVGRRRPRLAAQPTRLGGDAVALPTRVVRLAEDAVALPVLAETLESGAQAAARGGFTQVVTMPNTQPPRDTPERIIAEREASARLPVEIWPSGCCTVGRAGEHVAPIRAMHIAGARAVTDDGTMVFRDDVMEEVMREAAALDIVVMDHAVMQGVGRRRPRLAAQPTRLGGDAVALPFDGVIRDCEIARRYGLTIFPAEAEIMAVERDIALAKKTGCRVHLQHLSCAKSVQLLAEARREGISITGEVTPHHLALTTEDIPDNDATWKMNPPLGTPDDAAALRAAVKDGIITICATDHAPHSAATKAGGFTTGAFGVIGLETAVGASMKALIEEEGVPLMTWLRCWTIAPAALLRLPAPSFVPGARADLCIVAPEHWRFDRSHIASKSHNSPFIGRTLFGRVTATMRGGCMTNCTG